MVILRREKERLKIDKLGIEFKKLEKLQWDWSKGNKRDIANIKA